MPAEAVSGVPGGIGIRRRHDRVRPPVETLAARLRALVQEALQLDERPSVHLALEVDHGFERHPVFVPAPGVELGMIGGPQRDVAVVAEEPKQVPDLLLAAIAAPVLALDPVGRNLVAQPLARTTEDLHVLRVETDFFLELPIHRLLGSLAGLDAALRKLPRVLADPFAPEYLVLRVGDDDGDVRAIAVTVQHRDHLNSASYLDSSTLRHRLPSAGRLPAPVRRPAKSQREADSRGVTDSVRRWSRRSTATSTASPILPPVSTRCRSSTPAIGAPPRATMMSPKRIPASAAGESRVTDSTRAPLSCRSEKWRTTRRGRGRSCALTPRYARRTRPSRISAIATRSAVLEAIAKQIPCAGTMTAVFTPITAPAESTSGPPELPGFNAASVWMMLSRSLPVAPRIERPSALTMPAVTVC